ncbi:hypothetical protein ACH41H_12735 [Streptomyces sp. NPDC020800]|uniref:hypothetical protein n=1 Tax=Streptomyces sp. NPDC020800 TaxID=3365092 RepID=UPI00378BEF82
MQGEVGSGARAARRPAAGAGLPEVLDTGDPAAWPALDEGVRAEELSFPPYVVPARERAYGGRSPTAVLRGHGPLTEGQLVLTLCHRDGRIRHRALGRVAGLPALLTPSCCGRCWTTRWPGCGRGTGRGAEARNRMAEPFCAAWAGASGAAQAGASGAARAEASGTAWAGTRRSRRGRVPDAREVFCCP